MRFIFLNQFHPPDRAPTGTMLAAVTEHLFREGHECEVWCSGGSYGEAGDRSPPPETVGGPAGGVRVRRIGKLGAGKSFIGKLRGWLGFYLVLGARLLLARQRPDVIVAMTTPPFLSVLARAAAWRHGARHAHWVMDLYPDVLSAHGMLQESGLVYQGLAGLARWGFGGKRAGAVLTIGPCMAARVERLISGKRADSGLQAECGIHAAFSSDSSNHQPSTLNSQHSSIDTTLCRMNESRDESGGLCLPTTVSWVPLWSDGAGSGDSAADLEESARRLRRDRGWGEDEVVVLYSGNLGRGHLVAPMLECALGMADGARRLRWVFCAHGARLDEVRRFASKHPEVGVEFLEPVPAALLHAHLASADVHLASLHETWTGCMVPSKLQGIFAVGRPVVFLGSRESSIGRWVEESGGGWVVAPGDVAGLRAALDEARDPEERRHRGEAAGRFARENFNREINVKRVVEIFTR